MEFYLAQVNIGKILGPMDSPVMAEFAANLNNINALAENSEGFIWRLKDDNNNATSIKVFEDDFLLINMSVWADAESLFKFVYQTHHVDYVKRRKEWFEKMQEVYMALWYVPATHTPTPQEAIERLNYLKLHGETPHAFSYKKRFSIDEMKTYIPV